ncbi:5'/3'-nucleotidase SurE [Psychrosphaera sp. B3R10]|uniref:5'-nucleotidase SurE n=1 Tax=Psychrosphaera algicola TaxID=3023714 RepID=A0ABT5FBX4_9GAMM|nr:5'/3'-nucleotidase SurE [Psychrosphaera sp. G1-22]MBU2881060.1 5'/3'-nucleotidase SurE [Psychrosphaera sp. I2R16]MBU2989984.1 5'/3'-nucleotidase SurE [Psychrosphaera sp. B3R10]MDC2889053.1 5'/3'-nucleotidase SurE [Psychrosphaera sp. G1-22]
MKILVSNDDGVHAPGLEALYEALSTLGEVTVVAPDRNLSGASSSLTLTNPLRLHKHKNGFYSVNGTPTDCVHLAINQLMKTQPDIVVAGVNHGANLGDDTFYSGTVSAAAEGRHLGLPAVAMSLVSRNENNLKSAARVARDVVENIIKNPIPSDQILNVNVPDLPYEDIAGFEVTRLGRRHKAEMMQKQQDPWGRDIYWYGELGRELDAGEGTDFYAISLNKVSITPLKIDMTAYDSLETVANWVKQLEI